MTTRLAPLLALAASVGLLACRGPQPDPDPSPGPPPTPREDVVDVIHGRTVADPYRWLEQGEDPEVLAWVAAQDRHARAVLASSPHTEGLRAELRARWDLEAIVGPVIQRGPRYFYARRHRGRDKPVYYVREGLHGRERVLIDPAKLAPDGSLGVRSLHPSPDGRTLAYALRRNAADAATLHILDVDTGKVRSDETIPGARYAMPQWAPDSRSFYYVGLPDDPSIPPAERTGHASVRHHRLGRDPATDEVLYGPTGDPRTIPVPELTLGGRYLLMHLMHGAAGTTSVYIRDLEGEGGFRPLVTGGSARNYVFSHGEQLFMLTSEGAPRFRVLRVDLDRDPSSWPELVAEAPMALDQLAIMRGHVILAYLDEVNPRVVVQRIRDGRRWAVELPEQGAVLGIWTDARQSEALIGFGSLAAPDATIYRVPIPAEHQASVALEPFWAPGPEALATTAELVMDQRFASSADGTRVPVFVLHRADIELDGSAPAILYGYGGFGIPIKPGPNTLAQLWAARGGVWAQASLRGGGEYGEGWHRAGTKLDKQRVFDDFIAAGELLVDQGYTQAGKLGIYGGSNGGLLVGAASTQRPDRFGAVVCAVPLLDMVRYEKFGLGPLWIHEYGSIADPAEFAALHDYSPYHHIREGVAYPPMLMVSADTDDRVDPLHARKYVAAMQHASTSRRPVLLRTEHQAGHGGADSLSQQIAAYADVLAFMLGELDPGHAAG